MSSNEPNSKQGSAVAYIGMGLALTVASYYALSSHVSSLNGFNRTLDRQIILMQENQKLSASERTNDTPKALTPYLARHHPLGNSNDSLKVGMTPETQLIAQKKADEDNKRVQETYK